MPEVKQGPYGVEVKIERKPHPDSHYETRSVEIEPASGGFIARVRRRLKTQHERSDEYFEPYREPKPMVFKTVEEATEHLKSCLGGKKEGE